MCVVFQPPPRRLGQLRIFIVLLRRRSLHLRPGGTSPGWCHHCRGVWRSPRAARPWRGFAAWPRGRPGPHLPPSTPPPPLPLGRGFHSSTPTRASTSSARCPVPAAPTSAAGPPFVHVSCMSRLPQKRTRQPSDCRPRGNNHGLLPTSPSCAICARTQHRVRILPSNLDSTMSTSDKPCSRISRTASPHGRMPPSASSGPSTRRPPDGSASKKRRTVACGGLRLRGRGRTREQGPQRPAHSRHPANSRGACLSSAVGREQLVVRRDTNWSSHQAPASTAPVANTAVVVRRIQRSHVSPPTVAAAAVGVCATITLGRDQWSGSPHTHVPPFR